MNSDELTIEVICQNLPGTCFIDGQNPGGKVTREPVFLGIQKGHEVIEAVPADKKQILFRPIFRIGKQRNGSPNFLGPFAQGPPGERFFYLSWGVMRNRRQFEMFRRAKIHLNHLKWKPIELALSKNKPIVVMLNLTDEKGGPLCGSIREGRAQWQL